MCVLLSSPHPLQSTLTHTLTHILCLSFRLFCVTAPVHTSERSVVGLVQDPISGLLVTNGRQGMLQQYDIANDRHISDIDVVGRAFISRAFRRQVTPTSVSFAAFSHDGQTLATIEERQDRFSLGLLRLKFWTRDPNSRKFVLNTLVDPPHDKPVTSLLAHPTKNVFITTSIDGTIKLWGFRRYGGALLPTESSRNGERAREERRGEERERQRQRERERETEKGRQGGT